MCRLKGQYAQALAQIDEHLQHWPKFLVHKNKQRLTKITQYMIRMRRLATSTQPKLVPLATRFVTRLKCCFDYERKCKIIPELASSQLDYLRHQEQAFAGMQQAPYVECMLMPSECTLVCQR